ncbi:MAG: Sec-independent protein translocase TatA [Candidatus Aminicenantes bacterium 4484_214]|nr:MAG: Sec-independent protein translocase TatA [Candidatus Aminicenantes bacterium 4484_214]RLE08077.1 MAG: twin-arginine translocase TatA/TatE family subunit [Candidatus Aminicenantes bacterium]HDJ22990.1 twin-arginine translocase TatA/TatE family subunit [Candidatus Aminicenantes bacterium]
MFLFGPVGPSELLVIILLIVLIFGARRLPELGKSLGEGIKNFRKSISSKEEPEENKDKNKKDSSSD